MSVWNPSGSDDVHVDTTQWGVNMPWEVRMNNGRHCVYKKSTNEKVGCHDTHGEALEQMAALYAKEGVKMTDAASFLVNMDAVALSEQNTSWVHALPLGSYKHPVYGTLDITKERAMKFADSVKSKVRGIEPSIDYTHDNDKKAEAAGWVKDAEVRSDGLWVFVDWVDDAVDKIKEKKYKYFSSEFGDWQDPQGKTHQNVFVGGILTNRPFMKNLVPINLSESVIDNAFDLVSAITGKDVRGKETHMDEKELAAIIDGVTAKLAEKLTPLKPTVEPVKTEIAKLEEVEELKKLAEANPLVKVLLTHFESQAQSIENNRKQMRETMVDSKLSEFDNSKLTLSAAAKALTREIMLELPDTLLSKFAELMESVRTSQSFLVELGQRSGASIRPGYTMNDKSPYQQFQDNVNAIIAAEKVSYLEALERAAAADPKLYEGYRLGDGAPSSVGK